MATSHCSTPFGTITVVATARGICRVRFPNETRPLEDGDSSAAAATLAKGVSRKLARYFGGKAVEFDEPLDLNGASDFYQRVWRELRKVPRGKTLSYAELARRTGKPNAARAVGAAMATNPVPVLIPCHRVIRSDGSLGGFGGGLDLKRRLLELERTRG